MGTVVNVRDTLSRAVYYFTFNKCWSFRSSFVQIVTIPSSAAGQDKRSTDKLWGQGIATLIWKASRPRGWWTSAPRTIFPELVETSFILKEEGVLLVVANFLVQESFVLVAAQGGLVTMILKTSNKTIIFCSVTFYAWKSVSTFKDQNSENGPSCIFQAAGVTFSYKRCKARSKPWQGTKVRIKGIEKSSLFSVKHVGGKKNVEKAY